MISPSDIENICDRYNIGKYISIDAVTEGVLNDNYVITTDSGKYFIKSVREKARSKLPIIYGVECHMKSQGIPAITMLNTKSGEICVGGERDIFTLYDFVESDRSHKYKADDYKKMGVMLAKIHLAGRQKLPESLKVKDFSRPSPETILIKLNGYKEMILRKSDQDATDELMLKYINFKIEAMKQLEVVELPNDTLTHGDFQTGNILFDSKSRNIIGICDWEKAELAPRVYEIARSTLYICFDNNIDINTSLINAKEYLDGYRTIYPFEKMLLMKGLKMRIAKLINSAWIEDMYYNLHSSRANRFIDNEMRIMKLFLEGNLYKALEDII